MNRGEEFVGTSAFCGLGIALDCIMLENQFNLCVGMSLDRVFFWVGGGGVLIQILKFKVLCDFL